VVAVGISLILFALGTGLGFASISPWQGHGVGVKGFTIAAVIWLIVMQWISSLFGGYIAGRLRTRWIGTHAHEIFFRDTAHGLVTWSLATLLVAALAASSDTSSSVVLDYGIDKLFRTVGGGRAVGGAAASGTSGGAAGAGTGTSSLVTSNPDTSIAASSAEIAEARGEVNRVMLRSVTNGVTPDNRGVTPDEGVTPDDRAYLVALVAARTGSTDSEAQRRVDNFLASVKQSVDSAKAAADAARRDAAEAATYTALALLIGAFIASVSAALGGRLRDEHV
jgi:hypothetical protein